jgi:hypothetical protein
MFWFPSAHNAVPQATPETRRSQRLSAISRLTNWKQNENRMGTLDGQRSVCAGHAEVE